MIIRSEFIDPISAQAKTEPCVPDTFSRMSEILTCPYFSLFAPIVFPYLSLLYMEFIDQQFSLFVTIFPDLSLFVLICPYLLLVFPDLSMCHDPHSFLICPTFS